MQYTKLEPNSLNSLKRLNNQLCDVKDLLLEDSSKMGRISGSANYSRTITYDLVGTQNPLTVTHVGTTTLGVETIIETLTYVNPAINGSNVTSIIYS